MPIPTGPVQEATAPTVEATRPDAEPLTWERDAASGDYTATSGRHAYMIRRLGRPASDPWWQLFVDGAVTGDEVPLLRDAKAAGQAAEDA